MQFSSGVKAVHKHSEAKPSASLLALLARVGRIVRSLDLRDVQTVEGSGDIGMVVIMEKLCWTSWWVDCCIRWAVVGLEDLVGIVELHHDSWGKQQGTIVVGSGK